MSKRLGRCGRLASEDHLVNFLRLGDGFVWYVAPRAIWATGYVNERYTEIEFIRSHPAAVNSIPSFDNHDRVATLFVNSETTSSTYYSELRIRVHYPPTEHRGGVVATRTFNFSDYIKAPYHGATIFLVIVSADHYQWYSQKPLYEAQYDEVLLNREVNLWLLSL